MSQEIIDNLGLKPHPEGGRYRNTYESPNQISIKGRERPLLTTDYYYLGSGDFSAWCRVVSDKMLHYYSGSTATVHRLDTNGKMVHKVLGPVTESSKPQVLIPAGSWAAIEVDCENSFVLLGASVTPGFFFEELEFATKALAKQYAQHKNIILRLLRE